MDAKEKTVNPIKAVLDAAGELEGVLSVDLVTLRAFIRSSLREQRIETGDAERDAADAEQQALLHEALDKVGEVEERITEIYPRLYEAHNALAGKGV